MALSPDEQRKYIREHVESDLAFLWDDTKVSLANQVAIATAGFSTMRIFVGLADTKADLRTVLGRDFNLDPQANGAAADVRLQVACLLAAWDSASQMSVRESQLRTESKILGVTKAVTVPERVAMKRVYESVHGKLPVKEQPSSAYLSLKTEEVEADEPTASSLDEISSPDDIHMESTTSSSQDINGRVLVNRKRIKGSLPNGPEQFRMRLRIEASCWLYLAGKFTSKAWLQGLTPQLFQRYTDYFLGHKCNNMEVSDAVGNKVALKPPWAIVLGYELECRRYAFERVREDHEVLATALMDSIRNSELKECAFTSPIALMNKGNNKNLPPPSTFADDSFAARPTKSQRKALAKGKGKGKGMEKGKGAGKPGGKGSDGLVSVTPDNRQICYNYSSPAGCSNPNCARVHCCRVRGCSAAHPTHQHPAAAA